MIVQKLQQIRYQEHRCRLGRAKSSIDDKAPLVHKETLVKMYHHRADAVQYDRVTRENKHNLCCFNRIMRTHGRIDSFQPFRELPRNRVTNAINVIKKVEAQNCIIGNRILHVAGLMQTHRPLTEKDRERIRKAEEVDVPEPILRKYQNVSLPKDIHWKHLLLRPTIYFDMSIAGIWELGRVVIQLYTEACPQVVLEFVRFCVDQDKSRLKFVHLYPKLWLEGELQLEESTLNTPKIEYDMRAIDHNEPGSVLSFSNEYLKGFQDGYINFSMSFKPLRVLNGKRVGFGRVIHGSKLMNSLKDFGNKVGRPRRRIVLSGCGVL